MTRPGSLIPSDEFFHAVRRKLSVKVEHMAAKNILHSSGRLMKDEASSRENSTPPIGAPKAAATPAAQPPET